VLTLAEIERSLPNGFHDGELVGFEVNWENLELILRLRVDINSYADNSRSPIFQEAELRITGLHYFIIDPPDSSEIKLGAKGALWIDSDTATWEREPAELKRVRQKLSAEAFAHSFYVRDWNSFIHLAARDAQLVPVTRNSELETQ
jgi:hypothetical protein